MAAAVLMAAVVGLGPATARASLAVERAADLIHDTYRDLGEQLEIEMLPTRHDLGQCEDPRPFIKNRRINSSGRLFVGIECGGTRYGTIYLPAQIRVQGSYVVARDHVPAGSVLDASMLEVRDGDITALLDQGVFALEEAVGHVAGRRLSPGVALRRPFLQEVQMIERGAPVSFELLGPGFRIAGTGEALQSGNPGDRVQVRTDQRKTLAGVVTSRGVVVVRP